jgi:cytoskeleton protein RodZ
MATSTFGDSLKREREMRGVSLDEISTATRIPIRFLQAIENEQWDQLPGGVFNRGFVRAVAHYLGLDEEDIVAEYVMAVGDRPSVPVWTGRPPAVTSGMPRAAWIISALVIVALFAGSWFTARRVFAWRSARRAAQTSDVTALSARPSLAVPGMPTNTIPVVSPNETRTNSVARVETPSSEMNSGPVTNTASPPTVPPIPAVPGPMELKVEAGKKTKVTVQADANRVFQGTMKAGENRIFTAKDQFEVSARDAGALLLELNGKALAPIGPAGHSGKATLTREALKGVSGGGN